MTRLLSCLLILCCASRVLGVEAHSSAPRIVVSILQAGKPSSDLADAVEVLLSQDGKEEIVERRQVDRLLQEGALDQASTDPNQRIRLGRLLELDYFLTIRLPDAPGKPVLELVSALSSQVVASGTAPSPESDPKSLAADAETFLGSLSSAPPVRASRRVAVIDFNGADSSPSSGDALTQGLAAALREELAAAGLTVLDRSFGDEVVREHLLQENGMTAALQAAAPLMGANYLVYGETTNDRLRLRLLDAVSAKEVGEQEFPLSATDAAIQLPPEAVAWLLDHIQGVQVPTAPIAPTLQPEVLVPFYQGLAAFQQGRYFDAIDFFQKTRRLNTQFDEAYQWEARCYDALGLNVLGDAERRFVIKKLAEYGDDRPVFARQSEGITFVGLQGENFDPLEIRKFEMETIDAVAQRVPGDFQLPSDLARFRDEYDLFVGVGRTDGTNWSSTPNFLTRWSLEGKLERNEKEGTAITWKIIDTLSLKEKATVHVVLPSDPAEAEKAIGDGLSTLIAGAEQDGGFAPPVAMPPVADLLTKLDKRGQPSEANRALLEVLLQDPANPALWGRELVEDGSDSWNLQGFMNFGLRDYLIAHLPPDNSYRQWLELRQLSYYLPAKPRGVYFSGQKVDVFAALAAFRDGHPGRITACLAEYMILWEHLDELPSQTLLDRLEKLRAAIPNAQGVEQLSSVVFFENQVDQLIALVEIAAGLGQPPAGLPQNKYVDGSDDSPPCRLTAEPQIGGRTNLRTSSYWRADDWVDIGNPSWINPQQEARAALHILGRKTEGAMVDPAWFKESPDSVALLSFAIEAVSRAGASQQEPMLHPFDAAAERNDFQATVAHCRDHLLNDMEKVETVAQESYLEQQTERFLLGLTSFAYASTIDDSQYDSVRAALSAQIVKTHQRLGDASFQIGSLIWTGLPRLFPAPLFNMNYWDTNPHFFDPAKLIDQEEAAANWTTSPAVDLRWWNAIDNPLFIDRMLPDDFAAILLRREPQLEASFSQPTLGQKEAEFLFNYSLLLIHTSRFAEAEKWLRRISEGSEGSPNPQSDELQSNVFLQLAFCLHGEGRDAEAVPLLKQVIALADVRPMRRIDKIVPAGSKIAEGDSLQHTALRLLDQIRLDLLPGNLPANVLCMPIGVPQLGGMKINYYVRIPKGYRDDGTETHPILVLCPPINESTPDYCLDQNPWAQFADSHGFFLVVPQFLSFLDLNTTGKRFLHPQNWSGAATLEAVDQLAAHYRVAKQKLFLHGYGGGGGFVQRFARWAPDRIAAVSTHSSESWDWYETTQGLQPFSLQKRIPYLVTCGEEDNQSIRLEDRLHRGIRLVSNLRDQGALVIWKEWPGVAHEITPQMEEMARTFLAYYAEYGTEAPQFIGDLRDNTYLPINDPRADAIPPSSQQFLPDQKLASLWGTPR